ncbi:MAG: SDR family oxidoreductase [Synechococcaceae cyanobacterium RL_1_2]|nr:SDR family oxidoreductase [Synechococcaceae cyanobacterium RL_1_2]
MKVLVVGGTGRTGMEIVKNLHGRGVVCRALVRNLEKGQSYLPEGVELVEGDVLDLSSLRKAIAGCDYVICATGAAPSLNFAQPFLVDYQGTKNLISVIKNVIEESEVKRFVLVSSLCVSKLFHPLNLFWLVLWWKKQAEDYIKASGISYTIVRPGGLNATDTSKPIVVSGEDTLFGGSIPRSRVAEVCVEALGAEEAKNKVLEVIAQEDGPQEDWVVKFSRV